MMEKPTIQTLKNLANTPAFWVVISLALVLSPHLNRFPGWIIVLFVILFLWRIICINNEQWLPPKWILILISIFSLVGISDFRIVNRKNCGLRFTLNVAHRKTP